MCSLFQNCNPKSDALLEVVTVFYSNLCESSFMNINVKGNCCLYAQRAWNSGYYLRSAKFLPQASAKNPLFYISAILGPDAFCSTGFLQGEISLG